MMLSSIHVRLPRHVLDELSGVAKRTGLVTGELVRAGINRFLAEHANDPPTDLRVRVLTENAQMILSERSA